MNKIDINQNIVIIEVDDKTLENGALGRFPFDRKSYVPIIDFLSRQGASIIAFDMIFTEKSNYESDIIFNDSIKNAGNVIIGSYISTNEGDKLKFQESIYSDNLLSTGFLSPIINQKNHVVYSIFPFANLGGLNIIDHFSIAILKKYYKYIYNGNIEIYENKFDNDFYYLTEKKKIPFARKGTNEILINFIDYSENTYLKFRTFSFIDIYNESLSGEQTIDFDFKDKIILIGASAKGIKDNFYTPNGIDAGVYIHANMINTVLKNNYIQYFNKNIEYVLLLLLIILSVYFNLSRSGYILFLSNLSIGVIFLLVFPIIIIYFTKSILNFPVELLIGLFFSLAISNTVKYFIENKHKIKLNKALSEYVSADVANEILSGVGKINLDGENKKIAIFFSDIEGFTSISEKLSPEELVGFLREYLTDMSDIIMDNKGFINKYEGDAIMALWGVFGEDLNKTKSVCLSALEQQKILKKLNKKWTERGFSEIKARIGIHLGNAIIGNIGSKGRKMEFTALGDSVNLASRLEGVNKFYGTYICVSEEIYKLEKLNFEFKYLDKIRVQGKTKAVKIYELLGIKGEVEKEILITKKEFEKAIRFYLKKDFIKAKEIFEKLIKQGDCAGKMYLERCNIYIKTPPEDDWDGISIMTSK